MNGKKRSFKENTNPSFEMDLEEELATEGKRMTPQFIQIEAVFDISSRPKAPSRRPKSKDTVAVLANKFAAMNINCHNGNGIS